MYELKVYVRYMVIDTFVTDNLEDLRKYYVENWIYSEEYNDCYCAVFVNGRELNISEKIAILEK